MVSSVIGEAWYLALEAEVGIAMTIETIDGKVTVEDRNWLKYELYKARSESGDPLLQSLSIVIPLGEEVWIVRKEYGESS